MTQATVRVTVVCPHCDGHLPIETEQDILDGRNHILTHLPEDARHPDGG